MFVATKYTPFQLDYSHVLRLIAKHATKWNIVGGEIAYGALISMMKISPKSMGSGKNSSTLD